MTPAIPQGFRPIGPVYAPQFTTPVHTRQRRYTGRRAEGIRYERAGQEYLSQVYGDSYVPGPWIKFFTNGQWRWCQPDGLLFDIQRGIIHVVEFKYQHTTDAWWQTRHLYAPVLRAMFPFDLWQIQVCEVVKWFDPAVVFPEKITLANEVHFNSLTFKVHIWKP